MMICATWCSLGTLGACCMILYILASSFTKCTSIAYSYVNSVLQALYFCHPFRELVAQFPDKSNPATDFVPPATPREAQTKPKNSKLPTEKGKGNDANSTCNSEATGPPIPAKPPTMFSAPSKPTPDSCSPSRRSKQLVVFSVDVPSCGSIRRTAFVVDDFVHGYH